MKNRKLRTALLLLFLLSLFSVQETHRICQYGKYQKYHQMQIQSPWYRAHFFSKEQKAVTAYLSGDCKALFHNVEREIRYFPVPESTLDARLTVSFVDSWQAERNFKGRRGHEGTDLMAGKNERGVYPVLSMTDGTVTNMGWLEKGGYRIGITSDSGTYYYYAHLASYAPLSEGDPVRAGELLGFMGDSGYGSEGTTGQFAVHLHVGIYSYVDGEEISVNPYYVLCALKNRKLKYAYS